MKVLRTVGLLGILAALVILSASCGFLGQQAGPSSQGGGPPGGPGGGSPRQRPAVLVSVLALKEGSIASVLSYAGNVQARAQVNVVPKTSGRLEKLLVDVGTSVKAGDVIAELDHVTLDAQVKQAEANLTSAQARLSTVQSGGRTEDVASAQSALDAARARFEVVKRGATASDLQTAKGAVTAAQSRLEKARADLAKLRSPLSQDELATLRAAADKAAVAVQKAQADYDRVAYRPEVASLPQAATLQQATIDYQAALANFNARTAGPKAEDLASAEKAVASAEADLASAQAKLDQVQSGPSAEDLIVAEATVTQAANQVATKRNPYTDQDVKAAQAQVAVSQAALEVAKAQRAEANVAAPFSGIVAQKLLSEGALASPSAPIVAIVSPEVEVSISVEEARVGQLKVGQQVALTAAAYAGESFAGKVSSVSPTADARSHTFVVKVVPNTQDGKLRSGMFAEVKVTAEQKAAALLLPQEALIRKGEQAFAFAVGDGKATLKEVKIGLADDKNVEVLGGLAVGDQVVVAGGSSLIDGDSVRVAGQSDQSGQPRQQPNAPGKTGQPGQPGAKPGTSAKPEQRSGSDSARPGQ